MFMYIYVCVYIYTYICIYVFMYAHILLFRYFHIYIHTCEYMCMDAFCYIQSYQYVIPRRYKYKEPMFCILMDG